MKFCTDAYVHAPLGLKINWNLDRAPLSPDKPRGVLFNSTSRSSRLQMFFKLGVLENFRIFTGKHQSWSLLLIKLQDFRYAALSKRVSKIRDLL